MELIQINNFFIPTEDGVSDILLEQLDSLRTTSILMGYGEFIRFDVHQFGSLYLEYDKIRLGKFTIIRKKIDSSGAYLALEITFQYDRKNGITLTSYDKQKKFKGDKLLNFYEYALSQID
ncbi:hypothetical protein D3C81_333680 [compost metagenome]